MNEYPKVSKQFINNRLEKQFEIINELSSAILNLREREKIKLRQPLNSVTIESNSDEVIEAVEELSSVVESLTNIKSVKVIKTKQTSKRIKPIFARLGPIFKGYSQIVGEELIKTDPNEVIDSISRKGVYRLRTISGTFDVKEGYFSVIEKPMLDNTLESEFGVVSLDTQVTEELKEEYITREIIRNIQNVRKEMGFNRTSKIDLYVVADSFILEVINKSKSQIKKIVKAEMIKILEPPSDSIKKDIDISGNKVIIGVISSG